MDKKGIHVNITYAWSDPQLVHGKNAKYRMWEKNGQMYCMRLLELSQTRYEIDISSTLENVDAEVGVIFDIPDFAFDAQYILAVNTKPKPAITLSNVDSGARYMGPQADDMLKKLFKYRTSDDLLKDLFENSGVNWK